MEVLNPFEIFPKELWEIILDEVEHSKDIQSLLRGFPVLDISIDSKKKRFWYLDQILSFVCEWVTEMDILNLRLVCKKWQAKVDFFLQNQPLSRAYSHELHKDNPNFWNFIYNEYLQMIDLGFDISMCPQLLLIDEVLKHPQHRNPFVFRQLQIFFEDAEDNPTLEGYLLRISNLLRHSGGHLWVLRLHFTEMDESVHVSTPLEITGKLERNLPELSFLETIEICDQFFTSDNTFLPLLFKKYGSQIRRLKLELQEWNPCGHFFPALTEFELHGSYRSPEKITETLRTFASAQTIVKVVLSFESKILVHISVEQSILKWVKLFPKIKYFGINTSELLLEPVDLKEEGISDPEKHSIPSLQNLEIIDGPGLSYNFLRCFPSLQRLVIHRPKPRVNFSVPDSSVRLREQIQTAKIYESNVWEHLRKLNTVKLLSVENDYDFYRETYQKIKNAEENILE